MQSAGQVDGALVGEQGPDPIDVSPREPRPVALGPDESTESSERQVQVAEREGGEHAPGNLHGLGQLVVDDLVVQSGGESALLAREPVPESLGEGRQVTGGRAVARLEREESFPHPGPVARAVPVGGILLPRDVVRLQPRAKSARVDVEEGPHDVAAPVAKRAATRNAAEPGRPAPAEEAHEHGLGLVPEVVSDGHASDPPLARHPVQLAVAVPAGVVLGAGHHTGGGHADERRVQTLGEALDHSLVGGRRVRAAPAVIEVGEDEVEGQALVPRRSEEAGESRRIRAAAHPHEHPIGRPKEGVLSARADHLGDQ